MALPELKWPLLQVPNYARCRFIQRHGSLEICGYGTPGTTGDPLMDLSLSRQQKNYIVLRLELVEPIPAEDAWGQPAPLRSVTISLRPSAYNPTWEEMTRNAPRTYKGTVHVKFTTSTRPSDNANKVIPLVFRHPSTLLEILHVYEDLGIFWFSDLNGDPVGCRHYILQLMRCLDRILIGHVAGVDGGIVEVLKYRYTRPIMRGWGTDPDAIIQMGKLVDRGYFENQHDESWVPPDTFEVPR